VAEVEAWSSRVKLRSVTAIAPGGGLGVDRCVDRRSGKSRCHVCSQGRSRVASLLVKHALHPSVLLLIRWFRVRPPGAPPALLLVSASGAVQPQRVLPGVLVGFGVVELCDCGAGQVRDRGEADKRSCPRHRPWAPGGPTRCVRDPSWHRSQCHQVDVDHYQPKADDSLYEPGEGSLVGQFGPEGSRVRACCDLALVELCAQRSARLATQGDLICESCHWVMPHNRWLTWPSGCTTAEHVVVTRYRVIGISM
jgi:hypothetical protein